MLKIVGVLTAITCSIFAIPSLKSCDFVASRRNQHRDLRAGSRVRANARLSTRSVKGEKWSLLIKPNDVRRDGMWRTMAEDCPISRGMVRSSRVETA